MLDLLQKMEHGEIEVYRFDDMMLAYLDLECEGYVKQAAPSMPYYKRFIWTRKGVDVINGNN